MPAIPDFDCWQEETPGFKNWNSLFTRSYQYTYWQAFLLSYIFSLPKEYQRCFWDHGTPGNFAVNPPAHCTNTSGDTGQYAPRIFFGEWDKISDFNAFLLLSYAWEACELYFDPPPFTCTDLQGRCGGEGGPGTSVGYVKKGEYTVLCTKWLLEDDINQVVTIIHEMYHHAGLNHHAVEQDWECWTDNEGDTPILCETVNVAHGACGNTALKEPENYAMQAYRLGMAIENGVFLNCYLPPSGGGGGGGGGEECVGPDCLTLPPPPLEPGG